MTDEAPPTKHRFLAMGLCLVAAACLLFAAFTRTWLANSGGHMDIGFGLRSNFQCWTWNSNQQCQDHTNAGLVAHLREMGDRMGEDTSGVFAPMGWITFVVLLVTAAGLIAASAIAASGKKPQLPIAPTSVALLGLIITLITGCVFVATKPGPNGMVGVGLSFWVFGVGTVMGIAGAQMMAKVNRAPDPDLMAGAMNPDDY